MDKREFKPVTSVMFPPKELPYVGQVVPFDNEYWTVIKIQKIEWTKDPSYPMTGLKMNLLLEKLTEEQILVTDKEVKKAKKSKLKLI